MHMKVSYTDKDENARHFSYRWERLHVEDMILLSAAHAKITQVCKTYSCEGGYRWKVEKHKIAITMGVEIIIQISPQWNLIIGDLCKK